MRRHESMLLTVGEMAKLTSTSVRTLQFYDQKGILSPAVKDQSNRRLYSTEQVEDIKRIQSLKYLGLSLDDIKADSGSLDASTNLHQLAKREAALIDGQLKKLIKRSCVLQALCDMTDPSENSNETVNWSAVLGAIEATEVADHTTSRLQAEIVDADDSLVSDWHAIVGSTISLINAHVPPTAPEAHKLAISFIELNRKYGSNKVNARMGAGDDQSGFGKLRGNIVSYLKHAVSSYLKIAKPDQE